MICVLEQAPPASAPIAALSVPGPTHCLATVCPSAPVDRVSHKPGLRWGSSSARSGTVDRAVKATAIRIFMNSLSFGQEA